MGRRRTTERNSPETRASAGPRRVAILMGLDVGCCRNLIRGIHAYALEKQGWILRNSPCDPKVIPLVRAWRPDGIIATVFNREAARALARLRRPAVDTAFTISGLNFPLVDVDHAAVGRLAAEHLLSLGHSHFGFLGSKTACYSEAREASFAGRLAEAGYSLSNCHAEFLYEDPQLLRAGRHPRRPNPTREGTPRGHRSGHASHRAPIRVFQRRTPGRRFSPGCRHDAQSVPPPGKRARMTWTGKDRRILPCSIPSTALSNLRSAGHGELTTKNTKHAKGEL